MKSNKYAKLGSKWGMPAYRTPSSFRSKKSIKIKTIKIKDLSPKKSLIKISINK